jgi:hypothetical protein
LTFTRRGKIAVTAGTVVVLSGVGVGALALTGHAPTPIQRAFDEVTGTDHTDTPPPVCPLTGVEAPGGKIPLRPALAIKVENAPEARPQTGLNKADVVFEEPVEGGLTRFIAVYQCGDANSVGPVRSARMEDADVLIQLGRPVMGFAGGASPVKKAIARSGIVDVNYIEAPGAYTREATRVAPHNLYTTTAALWKAGVKVSKTHADAPSSLFGYADEIAGKSTKVGQIHLPFSGSYADVYWRWSAKDGAWLRAHGTEPHMLTDGGQVAAANVVVMQVKVGTSEIVDAAGNHSPSVDLTGKGKAYIFRNGRMIAGRWERPTLQDLTTFVTKSGDEIALAPGATWVELLPNAIAVETAKKPA